MRAAFAPCLFLSIPTMAVAQRVFDTHVHLWNGEASVRAYEAELKTTHQTVTRFAGILIAERGKMAETRRKNDELIALAARIPELFPIASVHYLYRKHFAAEPAVRNVPNRYLAVGH